MTTRKFIAKNGVDVRGSGIDSSTGTLDIKTNNTTRISISSTGAESHTGIATFSNVTDASSASTGALVVTGGIGVGGSIFVNGNVSGYSDKRLKEAIETIPDAMKKLHQVNGVTYTRIDSRKRETGVIAQQIKAILPEAVSGEGYLAVAYGNLAGIIIEGLKEVDNKVEKALSSLRILETPYEDLCVIMGEKQDRLINDAAGWLALCRQRQNEGIDQSDLVERIDSYILKVSLIKEQKGFPYVVKWPEQPSAI